MSNVSLRQLEYMIAAAETGSVTAAAAQLFLSQSAVSTALSELESALGVQIFIRRPRGIALTNAGQQILTDARRLLASMEDLRNSARAANEAVSGNLMVGCFSTLAPILLPSVIADFTKNHPEVELTFIEGSHAHMEDKLRDGSLDVAILYDYDFKLGVMSKDMTVSNLFSAPPYVILPEHHELAAKETVYLKDLAQQALVLFDLPPGGDYFLSLFAQQQLSPNILYRTTSFEMVRALVARGIGYSLLNQQTTITTSYEGLPFVTRALADDLRTLNVAAVHLTSVPPTRRAVAFIDQCRTSLARRI